MWSCKDLFKLAPSPFQNTDSKIFALGGEVLAEMKSKQEKRASVVPKNNSSEVSASKEEKEPENPFGGIKLR